MLKRMLVFLGLFLLLTRSGLNAQNTVQPDQRVLSLGVDLFFLASEQDEEMGITEAILADYSQTLEYLEYYGEQLKGNLKNKDLNIYYVDPYDWWQRPSDELAYIEISLHKRGDVITAPYLFVRSFSPSSLKISSIPYAQYNKANSTEFMLYPVVNGGMSLPLSQPEATSLTLDLATGISFYDMEDCEAAKPYLQRAYDESIRLNLTLAPSDFALPAYVKFYQGNCAAIKGDYNTASDLFQESINYDTYGSIAPKINLAWTLFEQGKQQDAFDMIKETLEKAETYKTFVFPFDSRSDILMRRAQLYALAEQYDDAINDLNAAIELTSDNPELYTLRGQMYLYLYQWDNVLSDYNKAIELDPTYADAYFLRGVLYYSILQTGAEHYPDALADFQRYLELAPDGDHAADAQKYADQIQAQQDALNS